MFSADDSAAPDGVSRRALITRAAMVGVATAWVVPVVQSVSMTPAHADTPSAPHVQPAPPVHDRPTAGVGAQHAQRGGSPSDLAETGPGMPVAPAIAIGAGAVALGVGAIALGATRRPKPGEDEAASS